MAADKTNKALNLATDMVDAADRLIGAFERFAAILDEKESSGIDFGDPAFVTALEASSIKHVDTNMLNSALSNSAAIYTAMKSGGTIAAFSDDGFQALRP